MLKRTSKYLAQYLALVSCPCTLGTITKSFETEEGPKEDNTL